MNLFVISLLLFPSVTAIDVCSQKICTCPSATTVNCDKKGWTTLTDYDFPARVSTLTLNFNELTFENDTDRIKLEHLKELKVLSLNGNPLRVIPPFNFDLIQTLSFEDTLLISAQFPSSYENSLLLRKVHLDRNKIVEIKETDFLALRGAKMNELRINDASVKQIHPEAFVPLRLLQSLSLQNNQLKSVDFLSGLKLLSSIKLDGNQFTSLPSQLSVRSLIRTFSFTRNLISIIDDSSPLYIWKKQNLTNTEIFLANNSFDCCRSRWFIDFLKNSSKYVADATRLTCVTPVDLSGQQLIQLNPAEMNCGGESPKNYRLVIGLSIVGGLIVLIVTVVLLVIFLLRKPSRSGYTEIGGVDDPDPTAPPNSSTGPVFPPYGEDDDVYSDRQTVISVTGSTAPTVSGAQD